MAKKEIKIKLSTAGKGKTERELKGVERTMNSLSKSVKGFVGAFVGIAVFTKVVSGLKNVITNTIKARDEIAKFSKATGTSVEFLSAIGFAAERSGASLDSVKVGMRGLIRSMQDVKDGLAEGVRKFEQLGIAAVDSEGNMRNSEEVFIDIADRIAAMTNETEKAAIAQEIFGRAGLQLVPLLEEGSVGIEKLMVKARELGIVFDQEAAVAAEKAADAMTDFDTASTALGQNLTTVAIPAITNLFNVLAGVVTGEATKELGEFTKAAGIKEWTAAIVQGIDPANRWALGVLAMTKAKEEFGFVGPLPQIVTPEDVDLAEELTEEQKKFKEIQDKILIGQANRLIHEQALLDLKKRGLVAYTEEEIKERAILEANMKKAPILGLIVKDHAKIVDSTSQAGMDAQFAASNQARWAREAANTRQQLFGAADALNSIIQMATGARKFSLSSLLGIGAGIAALIPGGQGVALGLSLGSTALRGLQGGGHVGADEPIIVGEKRRELFIPDTAGTIVPEVPASNNLTVILQGVFPGSLDELAEKIAERSNQGFNRIAVNA